MKFAPNDRKALVDVALGRAAPDLVLTGGLLANVMTREVHPADIAIKGERIAAVVPPGLGGWDASARRLDLAGATVAPGFIDPHVHIESSMVSVSEYARVAVSCGVTCIAADPHEIGNVLGVPGMSLLFEAARCVPLKVLLRVPGRIPALPASLETSNARLDLEGTLRMMAWPEAVCLAGDIAPALLLANDAEQAEKIALFAETGMTISGQSPGLAGRALCAFVAAGPEDSHVANSVEEILENQRLGLRSIVTLRPGRRLDRRHFAELAALVRDKKIETRFLQFCSDDIHAHNLQSEGHINHRVRVAVEEGFDPLVALQMATLNVAEGLRIDRDYGSVTPGKFADLQIVRDLREMRASTVLINGIPVLEGGRYVGTDKPFTYPEWARRTVHLPRAIEATDLRMAVGRRTGRAKVRAISATTPKEQREVELEVRDGAVQPDPAQNVSSIAVIERHSGSGGTGKGFVTGLSIRRGAVATTVSHDSHNIVVIGADHRDMALAANRLAELGGGYAVAVDGRVVFELALPIAGLMSEQPFERVAEQTRELERLLIEDLGCTFPTQPIMSLNFLCLPNIPKFGFTDKGLVSSRELSLVDSLLELHE